MRSSPAAAVKLMLSVWAVLALAPLVGACMGAECALATGVRAAHCGAATQAMLCCEELSSQPLDITTTSVPHSGLVVMVARPLDIERPHGRGDLASIGVAARHGPPLYALFSTLLI